MFDSRETLEDNEVAIARLTPRVFNSEQIQFMNGEEANLDQLGEIIFSLKNSPIKRLALGCTNGPGVINPSLNTLSKVKQYYQGKNSNKGIPGEYALLTSFVLDMLCYEIGNRVKLSLKELFIHRIPLTVMVRLLKLDRARYLHVVTLRDCRLTDYGCKVLFKNLSPVINHIDLTNNGITHKGASFIAKAIRKQIKLQDHNSFGIKSLFLNNNPIKSAGLKLLNEAIINDFSLKCVELRYCNINSVCDTFTLVSVNTEIAVFDLRGNPVSDPEDINKITKEVLKNNPPQHSTFKWSSSENLLIN